MANNPELHKELYDQGIAMRRRVLGDKYVDAALAKGSSDFAKPMQELVSEYCWGDIWNRPGLELKQRSLLNLAMLTALGKSQELASHVRGAINNGCTETEIRETLLQATVYSGVPAGVEAFRIADPLVQELKPPK